MKRISQGVVFEDNTYVLMEGNPIGERLAKVATE